MKKLMCTVLGLILALMPCSVATAENVTDADVAGVWYLNSITIDGITYNYDLISDSVSTLEINSDNTWTMNLMGDIGAGTWKMNDADAYILTNSETDLQKLMLIGDALLSTADGVTVIYVRKQATSKTNTITDMNNDSTSEQEQFEDNFATMSLDKEMISEYLAELNEDYATKYADVNRFQAEFDQEITEYESASQSFSSKILTAMLTGITLKDDDVNNIYALFQTMEDSVKNGISASIATSMSYLEVLFGGEDEASNNSLYNKMIIDLGDEYDATLETVEQIGQNFHNTLEQALEDKVISAEERQIILEYLTSYNELLSAHARE